LLTLRIIFLSEKLTASQLVKKLPFEIDERYPLDAIIYLLL